METTEAKDSPLIRIQLFGGLSTTWITVATGLAFLLAEFRIEQRDAIDEQQLNDIGFLIFTMTFMFTLLQVVAIGITSLRAPRDRAVIPGERDCLIVEAG